MSERYFINFDSEIEYFDSEQSRNEQLEYILDVQKDEILESNIKLEVGIITKEYIVRNCNESDFTEEELKERYSGTVPVYLHEIKHEYIDLNENLRLIQIENALTNQRLADIVDALKQIPDREFKDDFKKFMKEMSLLTSVLCDIKAQHEKESSTGAALRQLNATALKTNTILSDIVKEFKQISENIKNQ